MTDQQPPESLHSAAAALGYELRDRAGGGWNIYIAGTDFLLTWFDTEYALGRFLALGGHKERAE